MRFAFLENTDIDNTSGDTSSSNNNLSTIGCCREALPSEDEFFDRDMFEDFCFLHTYRKKDMDYYGSIFVLFERNLDLFSKDDRTRSEKSIIEGEPSSKDLAYIDSRSDQDADIRSTIAYCFYAIISSDIEGSFDVKWLRNDRDPTRKGEYLFGSYD